MYLVWSAYDHASVMAWLDRLRPLPFFVATALLPAFGLPTTPLYILAGASFGVLLGLAISWSAIVVNAILCFFIARRMRPVFERLLRRFKAEMPDFSERKRGALRFVLGVKIAPGPPAFVKNYALGMSGVSFRMYLIVAILFTGVYAAVFVVIGESLLDHRPSNAVVSIGVLAALVAAVVLYRRRKNRPAGPSGHRLESQPT
jgi:uncharacterized membrane protein YdjX (TVP38/TMEM64 family)